jgi:hypothetical protein
MRAPKKFGARFFIFSVSDHRSMFDPAVGND